MTTAGDPNAIYCVKCKARTDSADLKAVTMKNGRARGPGHLRWSAAPGRCASAPSASSEPRAGCTIFPYNRGSLRLRPGWRTPGMDRP